MKTVQNILIIVVMLLSMLFNNINAQITDENTYLINQYFQLNNASVLESNTKTQNIPEQSNYVILNQTGNKNQIEIKSNPNNSQAVTQKGNNNTYNFINYYNSNPSNFHILQQGNSNSLQIYGENSIIENMSILQKSNFKTIVITNY